MVFLLDYNIVVIMIIRIFWFMILKIWEMEVVWINFMFRLIMVVIMDIDDKMLFIERIRI